MPDFTLIKEHENRFLTSIPRLPQGKFVSVVILRETKDVAIFTTEGDILDTEKVPAGLQDLTPIDRAVMFKRKQVAPERRTGKAHLRRAVKGRKSRIEDCHLLDGLCGVCPDCLLYGYAAVVGEGARRSRVLTDSAFTVRPYEKVQEFKKFNSIDEETMTSGTITEFDHLKPGIILPCVETLVDVTADEFIYVLGNILKTTRYGKEASREGFVRNHIVAIAFSDVELFSNLELTQAFYDAFRSDCNVGLDDGYLTLGDFRKHLLSVLETLLRQVFGAVTVITDQEHSSECRVIWKGGLGTFLSELAAFYADEKAVCEFLQCLAESAKEFAEKAPIAAKAEEGKAPTPEEAEEGETEA